MGGMGSEKKGVDQGSWKENQIWMEYRTDTD